MCSPGGILLYMQLSSFVNVHLNVKIDGSCSGRFLVSTKRQNSETFDLENEVEETIISLKFNLQTCKENDVSKSSC